METKEAYCGLGGLEGPGIPLDKAEVASRMRSTDAPILRPRREGWGCLDARAQGAVVNDGETVVTLRRLVDLAIGLGRCSRLRWVARG